MAVKKGMTREEANQLYDSLKSAMESKYGKKRLESLIENDKKEKSAQQKTSSVSAKSTLDSKDIGRSGIGLKSPLSSPEKPLPITPRKQIGSGQRTALLCIVCVGVFKLILGAVAASGLIQGGTVDATMATLPVVSLPTFSEDELVILKSLDERRVDLEERGKKLDVREEEIERRDREFAARLTQLRELSEQLKGEREKGDKKRNVQLDQLAAVYSSMGPKEAAQLLEQLDVTISLSLIERMPEKRMAQILALMTPERALTLTQMLSKRGML